MKKSEIELKKKALEILLKDNPDALNLFKEIVSSEAEETQEQSGESPELKKARELVHEHNKKMEDK